MKKDKFLPLESLRGIAALSVAFFHFRIGSHFDNTFISNSWIMVDFFFVLSGFVISFNYINKIYKFGDLINFQKKRFLRLYPLHILTLIIFLIIEIAKYIAEVRYGMIANNSPFVENNFKTFIINLFLLQNWLLPILTYNYPSWSISAEFITYALFGILVLITKGKKLLIFILLLFFIISFGLLLRTYGMEENNISGPLRCMYSFSIGAMILIIYNIYKDKLLIKSSFPALLIILINIFFIIYFGKKEFQLIELLPLSFGLMIFCIVLTEKNLLIYKYLSSNLLVYLGTISYGVYMFHASIWWLITQSLRFIFKIPTTINSDGLSVIFIENKIVADIITILGILLIITISHFSFKYFETIFYKKS